MDVKQQTLGARSLAEITLSARWRSGDVLHEDLMHFERFSVWRDGDLLPPAIATRLPGILAGDHLTADCAPGELVAARDPRLQLRLPLAAFDRHYLPMRTIEPRLGRFYPRGMIHGTSDIFQGDWRPMRVLDVDAEQLLVDLNDPLAGLPIQIDLHLDGILEGGDDRGGRCNSCVEDLLRGPGLKTPHPAGRTVDFFADDGLQRMDPREDALFYQIPRLVQHLDSQALRHVRALYARLVPAGAPVLDLMASWDSHLDAVADPELHLLGMNAEELAANRAAGERLVQDLNQTPQLPYADASFAAVVCTASIEYLTRPLEILQEVLRVLRPGGRLILTYSDRWFPSKAIRVWGELHEFERTGLVLQLLRQAGFAELHSFSARGWPRPEDDAHIESRRSSDPLHAAWGSKPG